MKARAHVYVSGEVQGVCFRAYTRELAREIGVSGWVSNLFDGRVEAIFESERENVEKMVTLGRQAVAAGARWIMFHEGTVCDYTPRVTELAERVPGGPSTPAMMCLARDEDCFVSFGLSETDGDRYFTAQVLVGPRGASSTTPSAIGSRRRRW